MRWLLWLVMLSIFVGVWLFPVSTTFTRASGIVLFIYVWFGLLALVWKNRAARFTALGITVLTAVFLLLPAKSQRDRDALRSGLRRR